MRELKTIEMHTCGEPARIVIDGMPELRGSTMQEKEQDMREHYDNLRTAIIQEPRGHQNEALPPGGRLWRAVSQRRGL